MFTQVIIRKRKTDGHTTDGWTDRHTDVQHETIRHYIVAGYKNISSFCKCKSYSHFFQQNISIYAILNDQSFNDMFTNDIVSFEQLGPELEKLKIANRFSHFGLHLRSLASHFRSHLLILQSWNFYIFVAIVKEFPHCNFWTQMLVYCWNNKWYTNIDYTC